MKNYFFIILFSLSVNGICAHDLSRHQKDSINNYYNVGYYSQALNLKLDTVANPQLFAAADEWLGRKTAQRYNSTLNRELPRVKLIRNP